MLRFLLLPFTQNSWNYYESNFEAMLKNWNSLWSLQGWGYYYNMGFVDVIILRLAFMIPCNMFCFRNVLHLMLTAILYACKPFWEFTSGSSLLASISKQYLEIVLIVLTILDERNFNTQIRKQAERRSVTRWITAGRTCLAFILKSFIFRKMTPNSCF